MNTFGFEDAVMYLKRGFKLTRKGWNGKGQYICIKRPENGSEMSLPYIYIVTATKKLVPWVASQTDILSDDWVIYE